MFIVVHCFATAIRFRQRAAAVLAGDVVPFRRAFRSRRRVAPWHSTLAVCAALTRRVVVLRNPFGHGTLVPHRF
jgi:hypothetical protein